MPDGHRPVACTVTRCYSQPVETVPQDARVELKRYVPLFVLVAVAAAGAGALQTVVAAPGFTAWMHGFMGLFLLVFALLKLFDLEGYADGFEMYDLLARRSRAYARLYPFLELMLALAYLGNWYPKVTYTATIVLMGFGAFGVARALRRGVDVDCACMGTSLNVPLSTVALVENTGMVVMAAAMLVFLVLSA